MKIGKFELQQYKENKIDFKDLKGLLIRYFYPNLSEEEYKREEKRELIIAELKDCHHTSATIVFSVNGSPPKGTAILLREIYSDDWEGVLFLFGNRRRSKGYMVKIIKEEKKDGRI